MDEVSWTLSDVPLADEVENLLDGRPQRYEHVVVDETQDLTPMQLRMVGRRVRDGGVTVLGDLAQATGLWKYESWREICAHMGLSEDFELEELRLAYRVPREIMAVALPILELTAPSIEPPVAFRDGTEPRWHEVDPDALLGEVATLVGEHVQPNGTIAIISPAGLLGDLRRTLTDLNLEFGDAEGGTLSRSIELLTPSMSKGLEFDHVYIVEPNLIIREGHEDRRFQELYVALTRATRSLTCVYSERLRWPLAQSVAAARLVDAD